MSRAYESMLGQVDARLTTRQLTGLIDAQIQVSYSRCRVRGGEVEGHETARQLTQNVRLLSTILPS